MATATRKQAAATVTTKRMMNRGRHSVTIINVFLRSSIGPKSRKASMAEAGNTPVILAAITASDVEHSEQRKAIAIAAAISVTAPMPSIVPEPSVSGDSAVRTMDAAIVPDSRIGIMRMTSSCVCLRKCTKRERPSCPACCTAQPSQAGVRPLVSGRSRTAGERDGRTANDNPTALATSMPRPTRAATIHGLPVNANHVDQIAIGFITGAAHSSAVAYGSGSRLRTRFANVGTTMQSHTGRHSPPIIAIASPPASDFGTCRSNASALTNVLTAADIIAPTSMNGIVCNMSPAAPVPMRTSGIGRPRDSNMADAAMRNATSGVPMMRKR